MFSAHTYSKPTDVSMLRDSLHPVVMEILQMQAVDKPYLIKDGLSTAHIRLIYGISTAKPGLSHRLRPGNPKDK